MIARRLLPVLVVMGLCSTAAMCAMPVEQQTAMIQKYCAVCHKDAQPNGGLTLEHFDAARVVPQLAAMLVSKLYASALSASGQPLPDKATQDDLLNSLLAKAAGANRWVVSRGPELTASIIQQLPRAGTNYPPDLYRLSISCRPESREGEMQLAWSPATPKEGTVVSTSIDGKPFFGYKLTGKERMGNGQSGDSGPGAVTLYATHETSTFKAAERPGSMPLPTKSLTFRNFFGDETIAFPFESLDKKVRQGLAACFAGNAAGL